VNNKTSPVKKREIFGWAMYDFANSSYTTVVITYIYSAFFVSHIVPQSSQMRDSYWAIAIVISTLLSVILAPILGAMSDLSNHKKKYLTWLTTISVVFTAGLFFVEPGQIWFGITLLIFSNTAWMLSENFIASFLPELSTQRSIGRISGIGWGIGYIGGLLSLLLMIVLITADADKNTSEYINQNQFAMVVVAIFYMLAALPTYIFLKERKITPDNSPEISRQVILKHSLNKVGNMFELIQQNPLLFRFFIPFTVYSAGIAVVVKFFGIYASEELNISGTFLIMAGAILQIASMLGAVFFGMLQDKTGPSFALKLSLFWWLIGILAIYFLTPIASFFDSDVKEIFIVVAFIAGSALGATQSTSRAIVGMISKPKDAALSYGLWGMFGKLAIVLGMVFGPISDAVGRHQALLVIMVYFVIGIALLRLVPLQKISHVTQQGE